MADTVFVYSPPCLGCGQTTKLEITAEQRQRYYFDREFIQDVFPDWTPDQRELLITGTHPDCWDRLFGDEDSVRDDVVSD